MKAIHGVLAAGITLGCFAVGMTSPDKVVVYRNGHIEGGLNAWRAAVQRSQFWHGQMAFAKKEIADLEGWPAKRAAEKAASEELDREMSKLLEDLFADMPETRPTPAEQRADALRDQAHSLEEAADDVEFEAWRVERIADLQALIPVLQAKAQR